MTNFAWRGLGSGGLALGVSTDLGVGTNWTSTLGTNAVPTVTDSLFFNARPSTLAGAVHVLNATFQTAGTWTLQGAQLTLDGSMAVDANVILSGSGTVTGTITDNGTITASGGLLKLSGPIGGIGNLQIGAGATLDVSSTSVGISFLGSAGTLIDSQAGTIGTAISGFAAGDTIDLSSLAFAAGATATIAGGALTVTSGGASETLSVVNGIGNGTTFTVTADASGGTDIAILAAVAPPPSATAVPKTLTWAPKQIPVG